MHVFDLVERMWFKPPVRGTAPSPRHFHSSVWLATHRRVLIFGGYDGAGWRSDIFTLNVDTWLWEAASFPPGQPAPRERASGSTVVLEGDRMLLFGGYDGEAFLDDAWVLHTTGGEGGSGGDGPAGGEPPEPRRPPPALGMRVPGAAGGAAGEDAYPVSPLAFGWERLLKPGEEGGMDVGEGDSGGGPGGVLHTTGDAWPAARSGHAAIVIDNVALVVGGRHRAGRYNDAWALNLDDMRWVEVENVGAVFSERKTHTLGLVGSRLFLFGGHTGKGWAGDLYMAGVVGLMRAFAPPLTVPVPPSSILLDLAHALAPDLARAVVAPMGPFPALATDDRAILPLRSYAPTAFEAPCSSLYRHVQAAPALPPHGSRFSVLLCATSEFSEPPIALDLRTARQLLPNAAYEDAAYSGEGGPGGDEASDMEAEEAGGSAGGHMRMAGSGPGLTRSIVSEPGLLLGVSNTSLGKGALLLRGGGSGPSGGSEEMDTGGVDQSGCSSVLSVLGGGEAEGPHPVASYEPLFRAQWGDRLGTNFLAGPSSPPTAGEAGSGGGKTLPHSVSLSAPFSSPTPVGGDPGEGAGSSSSLLFHPPSFLPSYAPPALFSDVTLIIEGAPLHLHRVILAARSAYFRAMLTSSAHAAPGGGRDSVVIPLPGVNRDVATAVVRWLYTDALPSVPTLEGGLVVPLLITAQAWGLTRLSRLCQRFLEYRLTPSNAPTLLELADTHGARPLRAAAMDALLSAASYAPDTVTSAVAFIALREDLLREVLHRMRGDREKRAALKKAMRAAAAEWRARSLAGGGGVEGGEGGMSHFPAPASPASPIAPLAWPVGGGGVRHEPHPLISGFPFPYRGNLAPPAQQSSGAGREAPQRAFDSDEIEAGGAYVYGSDAGSDAEGQGTPAHVPPQPAPWREAAAAAGGGTPSMPPPFTTLADNMGFLQLRSPEGALLAGGAPPALSGRPAIPGTGESPSSDSVASSAGKRRRQAEGRGRAASGRGAAALDSAGGEGEGEEEDEEAQVARAIALSLSQSDGGGGGGGRGGGVPSAGAGGGRATTRSAARGARASQEGPPREEGGTKRQRTDRQ